MADITPLVVLGAGPGGHAAAFLAADLGMQVTLIDEEANPGGVCTYRGCIPSKALLHVAKLLGEATHAAEWGIDFGKPTIDVDRLRGFKQGVVDRLTGGRGQLTRQRKITYIQGRGSFVDANTLKVALTAGGEQDVRFEKLIIATGSRPATLANVGVGPDRLLDSTGALELKRVPTSLLVIGGGYIGLELGTVYAALGTEVTVVEMLDRILPGADGDLVNILARRIKKICKQVLTSTKVVKMEEKADGVHVTFDGEVEPKTQVFDQVLVSIGRRPNGHVPGIEHTGVEVTPRGFITVDPQRRTTVPHIYAIGDVAGDPMLAHKATYDAKIAVEHIAGHKVAFEPAAIPAVVFTDPELAWCGLTEAEAKERGIEVQVAKFPWGASGRATTVDRNDGLTKLILEPKTERVLGVGIVGINAGELIAEGTLAVEMAATASDLKMTIHAHPTLSETVMESAEVYFGTATNYYKPKK